MTTRRNFIKSSLLAGVGASVLTNIGLAASKAVLKRPIGIQLYTLHQEVQKDFKGTLTKIAKVGYKEFEFAGYFNNSAKEIRTLLDSLGVKAPGAHVPLKSFTENIDKVIEDAKIIGHTNVTVPWMDAKSLPTSDDFKKVAAQFNQFAEKCKNAGIQFSYHNHAFEFEKVDGIVPYDILLKETDKDLVKFEMDLYWVKKAGADIFAYFEQYPGRFPLWHVKDMDKGDASKNTEVGTGTLDFKAIFAKADQAGMKHFFVEQENFSIDKVESIKKSYSYLKSFV